jgi:hypothetical protein
VLSSKYIYDPDTVARVTTCADSYYHDFLSRLMPEVEYRAGSVSGTFRARITPVTGGAVTVTPVRSEDLKGMSAKRL